METKVCSFSDSAVALALGDIVDSEERRNIAIHVAGCVECQRSMAIGIVGAVVVDDVFPGLTVPPVAEAANVAPSLPEAPSATHRWPGLSMMSAAAGVLVGVLGAHLVRDPSLAPQELGVQSNRNLRGSAETAPADGIQVLRDLDARLVELEHGAEVPTEATVWLRGWTTGKRQAWVRVDGPAGTEVVGPFAIDETSHALLDSEGQAMGWRLDQGGLYQFAIQGGQDEACSSDGCRVLIIAR